MTYTYAYPRPAVTADCAVLSKINDKWHLLLIERKDNPYAGCWALPGGFMNIDETLEQCAARELEEETGLKNVTLEQVHAFSDLDRDPRGRTISVLFYGIVSGDHEKILAGDDAASCRWFPLDNLPPMAFDHRKMVEMLMKKKIVQAD